MTVSGLIDPMVGSVVAARYRIEARIARGGMATVYRAFDTRLDRTVAIKIMRPELGEDKDFIRRFDREARAAALLSHPNVVSVFDQGIDDGLPYIVMEYVEGLTLRQVLNQNTRLTPIDALAVVEQIAAALAAAHSVGLIHRDIKPENVLLTPAQTVKVTDFGLARTVSDATHAATTGMLMGTVSYIAPETVAARYADARSDVYSTGILLYELLTGKKPYTGETQLQIVMSHCNQDVPPPSAALSGSWLRSRQPIPPYLDQLVLAATARDPRLRPHDGRVLQSHIKQAKAALVAGITDDPWLDQQMHVVDDGQALTERISSQVSRTFKRLQQTPSPAPVTPVSPVDFQSRGTTVQADVTPEHTPVQDVATPPREKPSVARSQPSPTTTQRRPATRTGRKGPPRWRAVLALLIVLAILVGISYGTWYLVAGQFTAVPTVAGLSRENADTALAKAKIVGIYLEEYSETVAAGQTVRSEPVAGVKVTQDSEVKIFISKGAERFKMPNLIGKNQTDAAKTLADTQLKLGKVSEGWHDSAAIGSVIGSSADPDTPLKRGAVIDILLSKGPQPLQISDCSSKPFADCAAGLTKLGFAVTKTEQSDKKAAAGVVLSQNPTSGTGKKGDAITMVVSSGPVQIEVPDTRQKDQKAAEEALRNAGFVVKVEKLPNPAPFGVVSSSKPAAGEKASEGSTVTIFVL